MVSNAEKQTKLEEIIRLALNQETQPLAQARLRELLIADTNGGKLYKYRVCKDHSFDILRTHTIYGAKASEFNDPFDCSIGIDLQSFYDALFGNEFKIMDDIYNKYVSVLKGEKVLTDYSEPAKTAITILLQNKTLQNCIGNVSIKSDEDLADLIHNHPEMLAVFLITLLNVTGINNKFPITETQIEETIGLMPKEGIISLSNNPGDLTSFFKICFPGSDSDQMDLAEKWANKAYPFWGTSIKKYFNIFDDLEKQIQTELNNKFYIGSFSSDFKNRLMWSHYAEDHTGFCVEFDFSQVPDSISLFPVVYSKSRVKFPWNVAIDNSPEKMQQAKGLFIKALLTKDEVWEYEKEWRILAQANGERTIKMPPISCVYLGAQCNENDKQRIIEEVKDKGIPVKQMLLDRGEYNLHVETIS